MVGCGINDWNFFLFVGLVDGWIFFWLRFFFFFFFFCFMAVGGVDSGGF